MPHHYLSSSNPDYPNGFVNYSPLQNQIKDAGATFFRIGGNGYDEEGYYIGIDSSTNDYIAAIAAVKAVNTNAKFLIQIPFESSLINSSYMSPAQAKTLVENIKAVYNTEQFYYSIGNEWDLYVDSNETNSPYKYTSSEIAVYILAYALEMKKGDANIRIVAPAVTAFTATDQNGSSILDKLIGGTEDITGIISGTSTPADGKYYIDVVDYHTYRAGTNGNLSDTHVGTNYTTYRNASIAYPTGSFATHLGTPTSSNELQWMLKRANDTHNRTGSDKLTYAITEMNICHTNPDLTGSTPEKLNTTLGLGVRSFFAGQYWLDMFSAILKNGTTSGNCEVEFVMPWSVHESGGDGDPDDLGMTKGTIDQYQTPQALPVYWSYQMMAKNFKGTYFVNNCTTNASTHKAFAYVNTTSPANEIGVIVINQDEQTSSPRGTDITTKTLGISFDNSTPAETLKVILNIPSPPTASYSCTITNETSMLLVFNRTNGSLIRKEVYNLGDALRTIDTGPEVWGTPAANTLTITTQTQFNSYYDAVYSDLIISPPAGGITEDNPDSKIFRFSNSATVGGVNGDFEVPLGAEFTLLPTVTCP